MSENFHPGFQVSRDLSNTHFQKSQAFQIRFGGGKGVVYAVPESLLLFEGAPRQMLLRKSQIKFLVSDAREIDLRVVSTVRHCPQSLFMVSALKAFVDSGANSGTYTGAIEKIYDDAYDSIANLSPAGLEMLRQILRIFDDQMDRGTKARYGLFKLALQLKEQGIIPEDYRNSFLALFISKLAERARDKDPFKIPIPGSYNVLGLTDDYQVLEPNEVYICAHKETIEGSVLIYRDPVLHIGDIQEATAVGRDLLKRRMEQSCVSDVQDRMKFLEAMDNVIFFSQKDDPPLPNRLAGGDLDGDRFEILTRECGFWMETSLPDCYTDDAIATTETDTDTDTNTKITPFDIGELAKFIGRHIQNDCFEYLQARLMWLADQKKCGMKDPHVKELAKSLSKAVDYAKSGEAVHLLEDVLSNPAFKVLEPKPDFLRALNRKNPVNPDQKYYESQSLLGKIYRKVGKVSYDFPRVNPFHGESRYGPLEDFVNKIYKQWVPKRPEHAKVWERMEEYHDIDELKSGIQVERERYKAYRRTQHLLDGSEVDLFMRKKQDDFPDTFIDELYRIITNWLMAQYFEASPQTQPENNEIRFRCCLLIAW